VTATDVEGLVALVSDDVHWPDDDAGRLHGKDEVRAYWTEQRARTSTSNDQNLWMVLGGVT
jgi:hypothetical protein